MNPHAKHRKLDLLPLPYLADSMRYFRAITAQLSMPIMLQSDATDNANQSNPPRGRFDILTAAPTFWLQADDNRLHWYGENPPTWNLAGLDSFSALQALLHAVLIKDIDYSECAKHQLPFCGGLIGYCSYDLAREYIPLHGNTIKDIDVPFMQMGFYAWACIQDHHLKKSWLVVHPDCQKNLSNKLVNILLHGKNSPDVISDNETSPCCFISNTSKEEYERKFLAIKSYISDGDCYQINFSQRFSCETTDNPISLYQKLRLATPSPFCAYLSILGQENNAILSFSPERFVQLTPSGQVTTQPIKGTAPRSSDTNKDAALALSLKNDPKNRSENLMIVDLLRNDLGKVCETGSVIVKNLFELQTFSNVHHLVSTIEGKLEDGKNAADLLRACFPGGSITGAPKIRAMQIIDELELHQRSIYCGSIVVMSSHGAMDSNIMIRTLLLKNGELHCWGGGGIVSDSNISDEYSESIAKIQSLMDALQK